MVLNPLSLSAESAALLRCQNADVIEILRGHKDFVPGPKLLLHALSMAWWRKDDRVFSLICELLRAHPPEFSKALSTAIQVPWPNQYMAILIDRAVKEDCQSALYIAAECANVEAVKLLMNRDVNPSAPTQLQQTTETPLYAAMRAGHAECVDIMLSKVPYEAFKEMFQACSVDEDPLVIAVKENKQGVVKVMIEHGADVKKMVNMPGEKKPVLLSAYARSRWMFDVADLLDTAHIIVSKARERKGQT